MRCLYCDSSITPYPADGICPNCGAKLPPDNTPAWQPHVSLVTPPPVQQSRPVLIPGVNCCSRCHSTALQHKPRGFRWGLAILGLLCLSLPGLLLGLIGSKQQVSTCQACGHRFKSAS